MNSRSIRKQLEELRAAAGVKECPECGAPTFKRKPPIRIRWTRRDPREGEPAPCKTCGRTPFVVRWARRGA
jgi:hypothetical protein